jgi:hypothetical protein
MEQFRCGLIKGHTHTGINISTSPQLPAQFLPFQHKFYTFEYLYISGLTPFRTELYLTVSTKEFERRNLSVYVSASE